VTELINVLNAGALEVPIEKSPLSEFSISPLLGADVQKKGILAITIAAIVVVLFMLAYYRFAGVVANLCLMLNLLLVMGTMALIQATFTLPGLAGLVLTIGMAVDANVLIFERIREELNRGSSLRMAINNGFSRALTTIVDANLTTLIVAVVLYMIGTDQVKGFAVTLFIGIVTSMFCSLYFGRLIFDVCERKKWLTKLTMGSIVGPTSIDFVGKKSVALICSVVLIVCGMISLFARGRDNLDIDFRGGVMVTYVFEEPHKLDDVRAKLDANKDFAGNYTLEKLDIEDPDGKTTNTDPDMGIRYRLRTIETDQVEVSKDIVTTFDAEGWNLVIIKMEIGDIRAIADPTAKIESNGDEKSEEKPAVTVAQDEIGFEGGLRVSLTFSDEITIDMVRGNMLDAISELNDKKDKKDKYDEPELLFELKGVEGPKAKDNEVQRFTSMDIVVRQNLNKSDLATALSKMKTTMGNSPTFEEVNKFSKTVGVEMQRSAILAILISLVAIVAYIWFRFQKITFGLAAVVALVHDVLVVLGMVALFSYLNGTTIGNVLAIYDFKINLPMIAAFLTIIGYSLNDTIVVFDRIREVRGKNPALSSEMVNKSLNQTLSRTLLTSLTTFVVVVILYFMGGEGIHGFAFCLVIGVLVGTYSSIYVASPVLLWLMNRGEKPVVAT
jgi:SecD/SecF fusion protein